MEKMPEQLKSNFKVFSDLNFIVEYHEGTINLENYKANKQILASDERYRPDYDIIIDYRNAEFVGTIDEVNQYLSFLIEEKNIVGKRNSAILTSSPKQVSFVILFKVLGKKLPQTLRVFSTVESALGWLNIAISKKEVDDCINQLHESLQTNVS